MKKISIVFVVMIGLCMPALLCFGATQTAKPEKYVFSSAEDKELYLCIRAEMNKMTIDEKWQYTPPDETKNKWKGAVETSWISLGEHWNKGLITANDDQGVTNETFIYILSTIKRSHPKVMGVNLDVSSSNSPSGWNVSGYYHQGSLPIYDNSFDFIISKSFQWGQQIELKDSYSYTLEDQTVKDEIKQTLSETLRAYASSPETLKDTFISKKSSLLEAIEKTLAEHKAKKLSWNFDVFPPKLVASQMTPEDESKLLGTAKSDIQKEIAFAKKNYKEIHVEFIKILPFYGCWER